MHGMYPFPTIDEFKELIQLAKREDLRDDDVTSRLLIDEEAIGVGTLLQKSAGIVCGLPVVAHICRALDKYAVRCGGGFNHRVGLFDGLLVKDNHIGHVPVKDLSGFLGGIVARSRGEDAKRLIEVEVDTLEQLREVLKVDGIDVILLDNMDCPRMQQAVELRDKAYSASSGQAASAGSGQASKKGKIDLEASGGVTLETVRS